MRGIAFRRAQMQRMIDKAKHIVRADEWYTQRLVDGVMVREYTADPHIEAKKRANNLAVCSCNLCKPHKHYKLTKYEKRRYS